MPIDKKFKKNISKENFGFTLIELIVVMSLITILSVMVFLGRQGEEQKMSLQRTALQIAQDLREIQEMAMAISEEDCNGQKSSNFGLYFDENSYPESYLFFVDCNKNKSKDGSDNIIKEIKIEKGVKIIGVSPSSLDIIFVPPEPTIFINRESLGSEAEITVALKSNPLIPSNQKRIRINTAGRIETE